MGSKTVYIKRKDENTNIPKHLYADAKRAIGSSFSDSGQVNTGLTLEEEKRYMPDIVGAGSNEFEFKKKVKEYFCNISIKIPHGDGLKLEVGTDKDGNPLNVVDFVKYKYALSYPQVAPTQDICEKSKRYKYYVEDPTVKDEKAHLRLEERKKAYAEFVKLTNSERRMDMVLKVYKVNPDLIENKNKKEVELEHKLMQDPSNFLKIVTNKHLEGMSIVEEAISKEVLRKVGNAIFYMDEKIGDTKGDAILYLKDKSNSGTLSAIKAAINTFAI